MRSVGVQEGAVWGVSVREVLGCKWGECLRGVGVQERWECVRNVGMQTGKVCRERRGARVGKSTWNVGMSWAVPEVSPQNPRWLWSSAPHPGPVLQLRGALHNRWCKGDVPVLLPGLGDATSALLAWDWISSSMGSFSLPERWDPSAGGKSCWDGVRCPHQDEVGGTDAALLGSGCLDRGFGAGDARADSGKVSQRLQSGGKHPEGYSLPLPWQFAVVGPSKEEGKLKKAKLPR